MRLPRALSTVTAVATVTVALSGCGGDDPARTTPRADDSLGRPIGGQPPAADGVNGDARAAARAFLTSYLAVSYGRAKSGTLRSATASLRDRLRAQAPRVPPGIENRRPKVVALRLESVADGQVRATATVDDGDVAPYPLFATLARQPGGRWFAVTVGG